MKGGILTASRIKGITVEIGGDTTKLQTALKGVNSEIKNTQSELKDVEKLLKMDPGNTELLAQKEKLLAEAVAETKEKLSALKTAAEQANTALSNGTISQEQYDALQREIVETEQDLKKLETQASQSATALQSIAATGEKLKTAGDNISSVGTKLLPVTAAVAGLGTAAVTTASNFESSMSQVQATMGITSDAMSTLNGQSVNTMDALSDLAKQMGASTAFSATECAEALNYLALAGYDTQEMADTLPIVLNLAAAGDIELASASDMVTDAMSALGMETSEAGTMVDQMAKTASTTNTSVAQLGEGILTIGATAKSIKGGTAELNTALGILANNGIKGAEGGTHLRNVILSLQSPTDTASKCISQLGLNIYDSEGNMRSLNDILGDLNTSMEAMTSEEKNNIISTIFNKTDLSSVNALLANTGETWDSLQQSIEGSAGAAGQMAETQLDNLQGQITLLKSALEGLAISFGELLMPAIKSIVDVVQNVVDWLNSLDEGAKNTIVTIALVAAAMGPVLIVVGKVVSAIGTIMTILPKVASLLSGLKGAVAAFNAVCAANPILLIVAAVVALIAIFAVLWNKCDAFREFWINLWESIKSAVSTVIEVIKSVLTSAWSVISDGVTSAWTAISDFFSSIWDGIKSIFSAVLEVIKTIIMAYIEAYRTVITTVFNAIKTVITTVWDAIKSATETVLDAIKTVITTVWNAISTVITTVMNTIKSVITTLWNGIKTTITTIINAIKTAITTVFNNILAGIKTTVGNIASAIKTGFQSAISYITSLPAQAMQWGKDIINGIVSGIKSCISSVKSAVSSVASTIKSYLHFSVPDEGPLTDYESWMPDFIEGLAKGIEGSRSMISKAVSGIADEMVINPSVNAVTSTVDGSALGASSETTAVNGPLIQIQEMNVRDDSDIRKISQELNTLMMSGRRAKGLV